ALETVITARPARWAMSLSRVIRGASPVELATQGFTERTARQVHQSHRPPGAANGDHVAGGQLPDDLAVGAQDGGGADDLGLNRRGQWHDEGAIRKCVRANWGKGKNLGCREYYRAPGGK